MCAVGYARRDLKGAVPLFSCKILGHGFSGKQISSHFSGGPRAAASPEGGELATIVAELAAQVQMLVAAQSTKGPRVFNFL